MAAATPACPRIHRHLDADASVDAVKPPEDVSVSDARDADTRVDIATPDDTRSDPIVPDMVVTDVAGEPDACDPGTSKSPVESACLISEKYGVFVSPQGSDTTGIGTRAAPYKTLAKGLQSAKGNVMRVYACDEGTGYLDGAHHRRNARRNELCTADSSAPGGPTQRTRRARVRPATGVALVVKGLTAGLTVEDFEFNAADAAVGASSIGAIVDTALNVVFRGVKVTAGKGGGGVDGVDGAKGGDAPDAGVSRRGFLRSVPTGASGQIGGAWVEFERLRLARRQRRHGQSRNTNGATGVRWRFHKTDVTPPNVDNGGRNGPRSAKTGTQDQQEIPEQQRGS